LLTLLLNPIATKALNLQHEMIDYAVCFTPGGSCTQDIIEIIDSAKKQVLVQAYQLTSIPIALSLVQAHRRGVDVKVILDKSQERIKRSQSYTPAKFLQSHGIPTWIDYKPAIAHNKVMIIDSEIVITGSFNFSKAAQVRNAENLLILKGVNLAATYANNWRTREMVSKKIN